MNDGQVKQEPIPEIYIAAREYHRRAKLMRNEREWIERRRAKLLRIADRLSVSIGRGVGRIIREEARALDLSILRLTQKERTLNERGRMRFLAACELEQILMDKLALSLKLTRTKE